MAKRNWSLVGLIGGAFTIITAGIGLIQARLSAVAIIYSNAAQAPNNTGLALAGARLEEQTNLFHPLGMFLLTLGLALLFSTALQFGLSSITLKRPKRIEPVSSPKVFGLFRQPGLYSLIAAVVILLVAYSEYAEVRLAASNLWRALTVHPSFIVGFIVLSLLALGILNIAIKGSGSTETIPDAQSGTPA